MARWLPLAAVDDIPPGTARELVADDRIIALFRVDDAFYALDGICPHQGGPLGRGTVCGGIVTCPWHGWQFDVATGRHQANPALRQPSFPVKVEGGEIFVAMGE